MGKPNTAVKSSGLSGLEYYGWRDYRKLFSRRKGLILTVTLSVAFLAAVGAYLFPNSYQASAVIMVDPGKVPESYVKSTATIDAKQRLAMLEAQILSGPRLNQIANEMGLRTQPSADTAGQMTKDITVEPVTIGAAGKELQAFKISYTSRSPSLASAVANRLASQFIEENMKVREQQVLGTADFLGRELEKAKLELDEKGKALADLRSRYVAALPASQNLHLQALSAAQVELRSEIDATERAQQQKVYLQSLSADSPKIVDLDREGNTANAAGLEEERQRLLADLDQLRTRYGPSYPDVVTKMAEIRSIEQKIKEAADPSLQPKGPPGTKAHNPVLESQIAETDNEIQKHLTRQKELKSQIAFYRSSLEEAPEAEQQLTAAANDYANAEDRYKRLEEHKFSADISSDLETRQKAERFILLDPAQPPEHPYLPNRPLIDSLGLVAGLGVALFLVLALEILDGTVKSSKELSERVKTPMLVEMPWIAMKSGKRRWHALRALAVGGDLILALGYLSLLAAALK